MEKIHWAPKVRQMLIWQLYQNDALGTVDEALVGDVGYRLLQRCRGIWLATHRQVECPRCGTVFALKETATWRILPGPHACPTPDCGWETTAAVWHASWRHRDLLGAAAMPAVETYLHDYPLARIPQEQMLCIDQLIHAFHISLRTGEAGRSFANNLIEGSHQQVVDLLDRLFALPGGVDKERWRGELDGMWRKRRAQEDEPPKP
jgi:hypothetical protein